MERDRQDQHCLQGDDGGTHTLVDELLKLFESESAMLNHQFLMESTRMGRSYVSCIKFAGQPILPPVMTVERCEEMAMYKRQAIFTETRLKTRSQRKLLARVQCVVNSITKRASPPPDEGSVGTQEAPRVTASPSLPHKGSSYPQAPTTTDISNITPFGSPEILEKEIRSVSNQEQSTHNPRSPPVAEVLHMEKIESPRSDLTRDSGISSKVPSITPSVPQERNHEQLDTVAGITDISDEDEVEEQVRLESSAAPGVAEQKAPGQRRGQLESVADRLQKALKYQKAPQPPVLQTSARSSTSGTTSSASTDDTLLNHTVVAQGHTDIQTPPPIFAQQSTEEDMPSPDTTSSESSSSNTSPRTLDPLASQGSLLSKVALNVDLETGDSDSDGEETQVKKDEQVTHKIGDLREITLTRSQKIEAEDRLVTPEIQVPVEQRKNEENLQDLVCIQQTVPEDATILTLCDTEATNCKESKPQEVSQVEGPVSIQSDVSPPLKNQLREQPTSKEDAPLVVGTVSSHMDFLKVGPSNDTSGLAADMVTSPQNVSDSSMEQYAKSVNNSTMYTASTDLDKYMVGSMDTIRSSITTLPHILDEETPVLSEDDVEINLSDLVMLPDPATKRSEDTDISSGPPNITESPLPPKVPSPGQIVSDLSKLPKPISSTTMPQKGVPSAQEHLRRGSYTLDSPSTALLMATKQPQMSQMQSAEQEPLRETHLENNGQPEKTPAEDVAEKKVACSVPSNGNFEMTSSMEDLKLKPVQRTLNFEDDDDMSAASGIPQSVQIPNEQENVCNEQENVSIPHPVKDGKEEHLRRYLQNLGHMPRVQPLHQSQPGNVETKPLEAASQCSSPGQINPRSMSAPGGILPDTSTATSTEGPSTFSDGSLTHSLQMEFDALQHSLAEQQQAQLQRLLKEQQRQQFLMQQEFLKHEAMLLSSGCQEAGLEPWQQQQLLDKLMQQKQADLLQPKVSVGPVLQQNIKKRRRKTWQEQQPQEGWIIRQEPEAVEHTQQPFPANPVTVPPLSRPSSSVSRSGVSVTFEPHFHNYKPQLGDSPENLDPNHSKQKRVSFSDVDAVSESGSVTSRSVSSRSASRSGVYTDTGGPYYRLGTQYYPVPSIEPVMETVENGDSSILSCGSSPGHPVGGVYTQSPVSSVGSRTSRSNRSSPRTPRHIAMAGPKLTLYDVNIPPELQKKFERVSAVAKGFLTRRLMRSDKVQQIIKTATDTAEFAMNFQSESSIMKGIYSMQDKELVERVIAQLTAALYEIHEIFFELPVSERMALIAQTRVLEREKLFKKEASHAEKTKRLSSATLRAMERKKKAQAAEMAAFGNVRSKSAPPSTSSPRADRRSDLTGPLRRNHRFMMSRALKPIQTQLSPIKPVKDTLNRNPLLRRSAQYLYSRAMKRAVAQEKKEEKLAKIRNTSSAGKQAKAKVVTSTHGVKKPTRGASPGGATNKRSSALERPKTAPLNVTSAHPWK